MSGKHEFPSMLKRFIKRLVSEYSNNDMQSIATVLSESNCEMRLETSYDNWDGGQYGHDVVFLVPDRLMGLIPLDKQNEIQARIAQDLNKASSSLKTEFIEDVHFEYTDDDNDQTDQPIDEHTINRLWEPNTLKLFISHRDTSKSHVHELASLLERFGISSFVAHDSIEPDQEWQKEIEKAIQSMDVMLAFITDGFFDSAWTNQEIGFAMAKGTPIVSLKLENQDPIGFIKDRQAIRGDISNSGASANQIFDTIKNRLIHSASWKHLVISRFCRAISFDDAGQAAATLYEISDLSPNDVERIVTAFNENSQLNGCFELNRGTEFVNFINRYSSVKLELKQKRLIAVQPSTADDVPF